MTNITRRALPAARHIVQFFLALVLLAGCGPTPVVTRTPVAFEFAVCSAMQPLMDDLTTSYNAKFPHITFKLRRVNSAQAVEALWAGEVDLAATSWLTDTAFLWTTPVAIDGVAVVAHPSNPITNLSLLQLRDIFRGRSAEWSDVGGPPGDVTVISRESGSGARGKFEDAVMGGRNVTINAIVVASEQAVLDYASSITTSIGYVSSAYLTNTVKTISVEGIAPTPATEADRSYPLSRPLLFVTPEEPQGELRAFVAWVLSPEGQGIVGKKYGRVK
jgi:phosphate transport system substrate-binding protein